MATPQHIYTQLPDQPRLIRKPAKCSVIGCNGSAVIDNHCYRCHEEIVALESWQAHATLRAKHRAAARAKFFAMLRRNLWLALAALLEIAVIGASVFLIGRGCGAW